MLQEDAGLEMFKIEDIIVLKKIKQVLVYLRLEDRIGIQIMSNLVHSQIYSGIEESIL